MSYFTLIACEARKLDSCEGLADSFLHVEMGGGGGG